MLIFNAITLFIFICSIIFILKNIVDVIMNIKSEEPEQMMFTSENKIYLLFTVSYVITYIIMLIVN